MRGGGSYISQNDLRVHFGLGAAARVDRVEVRWPNGLEEEWADVPADRILTADGRHGTHGGRRPLTRVLLLACSSPSLLAQASRVRRARSPALTPAARARPRRDA